MPPADGARAVGHWATLLGTDGWRGQGCQRRIWERHGPAIWEACQAFWWEKRLGGESPEYLELELQI